MALVALSVFDFIWKNFVRLYCDSCHISIHLKNLSKLVNFCVVILILKMEKIHNVFGILFFIISRKVKMQMKCKKTPICTVYGEASVTDRMCQKRFVKFCAGDFLLDDAPWSRRPAEVDSDQIETLIENTQGYTTRGIVKILKIVKSIKLLVKNEKCVFYLMEKIKQTFWPTQYLQ